MTVTLTCSYLIEWADYYELAVVLGSCFLVNYVTADSKTNWVEGLIMVAFYIMIVSQPLVFFPATRANVHESQAITAWFYVGQPELEVMLNCPGSVAEAIASEAAGEGTAEEVVSELVARVAKAVL